MTLRRSIIGLKHAWRSLTAPSATRKSRPGSPSRGSPMIRIITRSSLLSGAAAAIILIRSDGVEFGLRDVLAPESAHDAQQGWTIRAVVQSRRDFLVRNTAQPWRQ